MLIAAWFTSSLLILLFMAGAKRATYTPAEIAAEYEQQYRDLNNLEKSQ